MVHELRDQHLCYQAGSRDALIDDVGRHWGLDQLLTHPADPFTTDMALDFELTRDVIELLTDILTDALEAATAAAFRVLGFVADVPARERRRQCCAPRL